MLGYPGTMARPLQTTHSGWPPLRGYWWGLLPFSVAFLAFAMTRGGFFVSDDFQTLHRAATAPDWLGASHLRYTKHVAWMRPVS